MKVIALSVAMTILGDTLPEEQVKDALCLTEIVHYEASGEGWAGKKAVANVALNRVDESAFPDSLCGVLAFPHAFAHRARGITLGSVTLTTRLDVTSFHETLDLVTRAMEGQLPDNTRGADHFFNPAVITPYWAANPITVTDIGNHRFIRLYR